MKGFKTKIFPIYKMLYLSDQANFVYNEIIYIKGDILD